MTGPQCRGIPLGRLVPSMGAVAAVLVLSACGSSTTAPTELPATQVDAGAVASADACPEGPPAGGPLADVWVAFDGFVGTIVNDTGAGVWVSNDNGRPLKETPRTPCFLDAGKSAAFASSARALLSVSLTATDRSGTRIELWDRGDGDPTARVSAFRQNPPAKNCGVSWRKSLIVNEPLDLEARAGTGYSGQIRVTLVDDQAAARTFTGQDDRYLEEWRRVDVAVTQLGTCN